MEKMSGSEKSAPLAGLEETMKSLGWAFKRLGEESGPERSLLLETPEEDCLVELFPDGRLACQFGVDMEEMRNLLTGDQTEDMQDDELVRVARYHLKSIVDRYRKALIKEGLEEGVDVTEDYYAIVFDTRMDLSDKQKVMHDLARYLLIFEKAIPK